MFKENERDSKLASNILMQIFSPIITSQRIMCSQFGNSYTSCQCQNGLNIAFEEVIYRIDIVPKSAFKL